MSTELTVRQLEELCAKIAAQRDTVAVIAAEKKVEEERLEELEATMVATLRELDMTSFKSKSGQFIISHRMSVKLPATPEDRQKFFDYLKGRELFDNMISVNSQTLNRFYKDEFAEAKERGDFDFEIPGIGPATVVETLSVKKS